MRIEYFLNNVLSNNKFDSFTVTDLRDAYMSENKAYTDLAQTRHFVYRQILRFLKHGLLEKQSALNARESLYVKTGKFYDTKFNVCRQKPGRPSKVKNESYLNDNLQNIRERLKQCNVDLLASVGESEEYMRLYKTNPELKSILEEKYLTARDNSSKLLGQIKALNSVLSHYSS